MTTKPTTLKRRRLTPVLTIERKRETAPTYGQGRGGRPWRRIREQVLRRDRFLCQCPDCITAAVPKPADEVDHISNERDAFGRLDDDLSNLRAVNSECHRRITRQQIARAGQIATMYPDWMPVTAKPLVVVCGPPGAGKTTHARDMAEPGDLLIDLDYLAIDVLGKHLWHCSPEERKGVIRVRNEMLAEFMRGHTKHTRCILIDTAGKFKRRKFWLDRGAEVVVMDTDKEMCRERVRGDTERPAAQNESRLAAIDRWE